MLNPHLEAYQAVQTETADPPELVLMLFDGAIRFLRQAGRALERRDLGRFGESAARAFAIVNELLTMLDHEAGGEIAASLGRVYAFILRRLHQAIVERDRRGLVEVLVPLQSLREAFTGATGGHAHA